MDQDHHGFTVSGGLGHDVNHGHVITMIKQVLPFELGPPEGQGHGDCIQLMPVDTHLLVLKALLGEGTLTPLSLKVTAKPLISSISEQVHIQGAGPVCIIEEADPIPAG